LATRIFELAKELGVTSKVILTKCRAEGVDVKNHMSTISVGLEMTIREWFGEQAESHSAVEVTEHVDLEEAREEARKVRRHGEEGGEGLAEGEAPLPGGEVPPAAEPAELAPAAEAAGKAVAAEAAETAVAVAEPPQVQEQPPGVVEVEPPPAEVAAEVAAPAAPEAPPEVAAEAEPPPPEAQAAQAPQPAPAEERPAPRPVPGQRRPREEIKPAGPQVVPRPPKLTGPRIVRIEHAEIIDRPPRRRQEPVTPRVGPRTLAPGEPPPPDKTRRPTKAVATATEESEAARKKGKRRSPRRRGTGTGRSAESGTTERIKEWSERDQQERTARLAAASGGLRRHRASVRKDGGALSPTLRSEKVEIEEPITVKSLSAAAGLKSAEIIRKLMEMGTFATVNQSITVEQAESIMAGFGVELDVRRARTAEEELVEKLEARQPVKKVSRAPVVTFLGHVDHGKTSLLDRIRQAHVAPGEAGGITQHIGAYRYDVGDRHVVFLDTPGHEAFTAMRARGANMTDVVVLVVAADDGVMPQTVEALSHARAAKVPIVVALNKVDVPNANIQRAMGQLAEHKLQPREWGGDTEVIKTSAATGEGIDDLVEVLSLEAELLELTAEEDVPASGFVIEASMDPGRGALARLLIRNGTLKVGDVLLAGRGHGRVRQILDDKGKEVQSSGPATPVEVTGLSEAPEAGDRFYVVADIDQARSVAEDRRQRARTEQLATGGPATLETFLGQIEAGQKTEVPLIIKADVQGSVEALVGSLEKLSTDEVRVNLLHTATGGISTGDVMLAEASKAIILGFNVVPDASARQMAERTGVSIRLYRIIYDLIDDVRKALEEGLAPEIREETLGRAEVRQVFKVSRVGSIAGCYVIDGIVNRNAKVRITRNNIVVEDGRALDSLKRFKDDVREVRSGLECGLKIAGYDDVKEGDILEFYKKVEVARKL
jgi:translation initiation factor IF-2